MHIHLHIHTHNDGDNKILLGINSIIQKLQFMSDQNDKIQALLGEINGSTNNIAADLERLAGIINGGLTADEATKVVADLQAAADKLKAVADQNLEETPAPEQP